MSKVDEIFVAHAKNSNFDGKAVFPDDFTTVATVKIPKGQEDAEPKALARHAFQETNHIDAPWFDNESVTVIGEPNHRSTSVGDVVITPDGTIVLCKPIGWERIGTNDFGAKNDAA